MNCEFNLEGSLYDAVFQFEKSTTKKPEPKVNLEDKPNTGKRKMRRIKK